jgi:hypothetical protein
MESGKFVAEIPNQAFECLACSREWMCLLSPIARIDTALERRIHANGEMNFLDARQNGESFFPHTNLNAGETSMTTYQTTWSIIDTSADDEIDIGQLAYFRQRFRNEIHQAVLKRFIELVDYHGFTQARLAKKLGKKPSQISRWLAAPGNWTMDSISDVLLAMNSEPTSEVRCLDNLPRQNFTVEAGTTLSVEPKLSAPGRYAVDRTGAGTQRPARVEIRAVNS